MSQLMRDQFIREMTDELESSTGLGMKMGDAWKPIFHQRKTDKRRVERQTFVWPSVVGPTEEGGALNRLVVKHGYGSYVVPQTYTGEVKISHEFMRDLRYEEVKRDSFGLGVAFTRNRYNLACQILINGFSSVQSPDANSLFYGDHTLSGSSTYDGTGNDNLMSGAPLTTDAFDEAVSKLFTTVNENGDTMPVAINRIRIICVPQNARQALQIAGSSHEPENMNNAINVYSGSYGRYEVEVVILPLLYGLANVAGYNWAATQWYVQLPSDHELYFYEREAIDTWMVKDTNSLSVLYQGLDSFGFMVSDWRYIIGSKGI